MTPAKRRKKGSVLVEINGSFCKGCDICIDFCPFAVFEKSETLNKKGYYLPIVVRTEECTGCKICELLCPEMAIVLTDGQEPGKTKDDEEDDNR